MNKNKLFIVLIAGIITVFFLIGCSLKLLMPKSFTDAGVTTSVLLSAPTGLSATDKDTSYRIQISWNSVTGADGYIVYRDGSPIGMPTSASMYDYVESTGPFSYSVVAFSSNGGVSTSSESDNGSVTNSIAAPISFMAFATNGKNAGAIPPAITLSWTTGSAKYNLYRYEVKERGYDGCALEYSLLQSGITTNVYLDTAIEAGSTYYYKLQAEDNNGNKSLFLSYSNFVPKYNAPAGVSASQDSSSQIRVSWTDVSGCYMYEIYKSSASNGAYGLQGTSETSSFIYVLGDNNSNRTNWFKIKGVYKYYMTDISSGKPEVIAYDKKTLYSSVVKGIAVSNTALSLTTPSSVWASDGKYRDYILVNWTSVSAASSYKVYRATYNGSYIPITTITGATQYKDYSVMQNKEYYYKIQSINSTNVTYLSTYDTGSAVYYVWSGNFDAYEEKSFEFPMVNSVNYKIVAKGEKTIKNLQSYRENGSYLDSDMYSTDLTNTFTAPSSENCQVKIENYYSDQFIIVEVTGQ